MYEKEIEYLRYVASEAGAAYTSSYESIIALLRAAQPEDEAAEREHCEALAIELANVRAPKGPGAGAANRFQTYAQDLLMRERAAARAELQARIKELEAALSDREERAEKEYDIGYAAGYRHGEEDAEIWMEP